MPTLIRGLLALPDMKINDSKNPKLYYSKSKMQKVIF